MTSSIKTFIDQIYKTILSKSISEGILKYSKNYFLRFFLIGSLSGLVYIATNEIKLPIILLVLLDFYIVDL